MISKVKTETPISGASDWFLRSGIQITSGHEKLKGGVSAWYELHKRLYPFVYSEITGYAITTFVFLHRITQDERFLDRAKMAARWLEKNAFHGKGGVKTRYYLVKRYETPNYTFNAGRIYAFDSGVVGYGFLQLHRVCPKSSYLSCAERAWDFLEHTLRNGNNFYTPYYDAKSRRTGEDLGKWSDQAGSFHAKLALFFIDFFFVSRKKIFKDAATRLLDKVVKMQESNGRFITGKKDKSTHLHPHSYTLEGLLYGAHYLDRPDYLKSALKGYKWLLKAVSENGSVSAIYDSSGFAFHERSDIVAQVLRIGSVLWGLGQIHGEETRRTLKKIYDHLLLFQYIEPGSQKGGFLYGADTDGRLRLHLNAWATMFSLQAIWMYESFVENKKPVSLENLI